MKSNIIKNKIFIRISSLLSIIFFIIVWHLYVKFMKVPEFILPSPYNVGLQFVEIIKDGSLINHMVFTSLGILSGFLLGSLLGFLLGYFILKFKYIDAAIFPYLIAIQATPKVTLIPLFVIWFGLGITSKLLLIILSAFFPVLLNTLIGFRSVPNEYYELMKILRATDKQTLYKIKIPLSLPIILAGLKVAMVQSVIGTIVAEWVSGKAGLGYLLVYASTQFNSRLLIASIFATTLLGLFYYWMIELLEWRVLFWHESRIILEEGL